MRVIIDRFEGDFAVVEISEGRFTQIPKLLVENANEGDVVDILVNKDETLKIPTGIRVKINSSWALLLFPRSSLGFKYRMQLDNTVGIIDSDYYNSDNEGHIILKITNDSKENKQMIVEKNKGICQGIFFEFGITEDDDVIETRNGGFGSTN